MTQKNVNLARKCLSQSLNFGRTIINHDSLEIGVGIFLDPVEPLDEDRRYFSVSNEEADRNTLVCSFITDNNGVQIASWVQRHF